MRVFPILLTMLVPSAHAASLEASDASAPTEQVHTLSSVVASTSRNSPPIWEFVRGQKKILILGTLAYTPSHADFDSAALEERISAAETFISSPGLVVGENIGLLRGMTLWAGIRQNKRNPYDQTLSELLPEEVRTKWQRAKATYLGNESSVEPLRPMYAAFEVFEAARKRTGLQSNARLRSTIEAAARKRRVEIVDARLHLAIASPREAVKQFDVPRPDDIKCLDQTLNQLDAFLENAGRMSEAWSDGDWMRMGELTRNGSPMTFCWAHLTNEAIAKQQGIHNLSERIDQAWLTEVEKVLTRHDSVFATLSVLELLEDGRMVMALKNAGFEMVPPSPPDRS